ncbi:ABC transporter ATP-binding protein [Plantactinospora veratri]|uniref:ABC transporter ATP-binding protein n=1 Tax=Plantactinospora veratri TaxID=1436122 RepID=A0ABU7SKL3_9ACTN
MSIRWCRVRRSFESTQSPNWRTGDRPEHVRRHHLGRRPQNPAQLHSRWGRVTMTPETRRQTLIRLTRDRLEIVRLTGRAGWPMVVTAVLVNLVVGLMPPAFVVASSILLGKVPAAVVAGLGSPEWDGLVIAFLLAAAAFVGQQIVAPVQELLGQLVSRRIDGLVSDELMAIATSTDGIGPLEDPGLVEHLRVAARELETWLFSPGEACAGLVALVGRYTSLAGYAVVVGVLLSWPVAVAMTAAVVLQRYGQRGGLRMFAEERFLLDPQELRNDYLREVASAAGSAKEMRVFGLHHFFVDFWRQSFLEWLVPVWKARRRIYLWRFLGITSFSLVITAAVFAFTGRVATDATAGLTLTGFAMVMQAALGALRLGEYYPESDLQTALGMHAYQKVKSFREGVADYAEHTAGEIAPPTPATGMIQFDRVSFHYPGDNRMIFQELDLTIPIGQCTALVGVNGAGKTTLVKLLARLYEPTSGTIRLDGVDIRSYGLDEWRARLGVTFQEFARFEVAAADNVGFGAVEHLDDRAGIRSAIEAVNLHELLDNLPRGIQTPLARHLEDGTDLSGGQWQRVALARALFGLRHGASILVLDEPTASLDVRAEAGFFREFTQLTEGATTLLISHRFSTVRQADRIVVLDGGRVAESGSHDELMAQEGEYARLFRLQADRFTDQTARTA